MSRAIKRTAEDRNWSRRVRQRDRYMCRLCHVHYPPNSRALHAHHIFTRSRKATRHDDDNGISLCYGCHMWAHKNPLEFHAWVGDEIGADLYDEVQKRSRRMAK